MDRTNSSDTDLSSLTPPPASNSSTNDVEGIWSPDIEQSFIEALAIYPPCGRRKIILTEEGKMYGRNELVSRYIKIRTGKVRTRKQVSSHLQVLAKRRAKDLQDLRNDAEAQKRILDRLKQYTSAEIVSMTLDNKDDRNQLIKISKHSSRSKSNDKHSSRIQQTSTTMNRLKIKDESFNSPVRTNQSTTGILLPRAPTMKNSLTKRSTSNTPIPSFLPTSSLPCGSMHSMNQMVNHHSPLILPSASIGHDDFRLQEMCAFIELKRTINSTHPSRMYPYSEGCSIFQHDLLRLHMNDIQMKNLHTFETISIDQIFDKFPHYDGLKDLYEQNPNGSFYLIKFWADVSPPLSIMNSVNNRDESFYTSYTYTSCSNRPIRISTRLCSFGKQVLEKVEISDYPQLDQFHQFIYRFDRSPLCDYMIQFIQKLRSLPNTPMMNSVLENFTILQVIKCRDESDQLLLCLAFVFEIGTSDGSGPQYQVYKLVAN